MSSGMKKGILFVSICVVAILVLYAMWPTKMIQYLTKPVTAEGESDRSSLSYHAGGSWPVVIRKKMPELARESEVAVSNGMPLVIVKKLPAEKVADLQPVAVPPQRNELAPIPASVADAAAPETSRPKTEGKDLKAITVARNDGVSSTSESQLQDQAAGGNKPATQEKESGSAASKPEIAAATGSQPQLKEKPAVHKIEDKIVPMPYSIMLASCRRPDSAQNVMNTNRRKGLTPYVVRVDLGPKGIWWRVFEGKYSSAAEASDIQSRYKLSGALVKKTPYAIQIGAFDNQTDAAAEVRRLVKLKHSPYFVPARQNKQRLLVGAFASKKGARLLAEELTARGIPNQIVNR